MPEESRTFRAGLVLGLSAYLIWGVLPLYFKAVDKVDPVEIVAHRIVWSVLFLAILLTIWRKWGLLRAAASDGKVLLTLAVTATLIAVNWLVYIYAVVNDHVLEGSLGYYLNPLVNVLLGIILLKEKMTRLQYVAAALAAAGVAVLAAGAGSGLWISLTLAATFGLYGFLRKVAPVDSLEGLAIETALLGPLALGWIIWAQQAGHGGFGRFGLDIDILLALGGVITAIPLLLFTAAARRLPYSLLGFLQYIAPTLQFLLAVLVFGERLTIPHLICFGAIWTALALFSFEGIRMARAQPARS